MTTDTITLRETVASFGLTPADDGWHGPFGLYGIQRDIFGLLRAVGPDNAISNTGVADEAAAALVRCWCPDAEAISEMVEEGCQEEARGEAAAFVRAWDMFAPGVVAALPGAEADLAHRHQDDREAVTDAPLLRGTAESLGLTETEDGWRGPFGLYGVVRGTDGLLRAFGPHNTISKTGVTDAVAVELLGSCLPDAAEMAELFGEDPVEAESGAELFVLDWDDAVAEAGPGGDVKDVLASWHEEGRKSEAKMAADMANLDAVADRHGLTRTGGGWRGPCGLYGIERRTTGFLHAVGPLGKVSCIGVTDAEALDLLGRCCPDPDRVEREFTQGDRLEAENMAVGFVLSWDVFAPGGALDGFSALTWKRERA